MAKVEEANSVKPEKFHGQNFGRWQKQTKYWLTVLSLVSALEDNEVVGSWLTPEQIEFHCFNRIRSALSDHLYDVYHSTTTTAKELWKTLEAEYGTMDAGIERFTVSNFNGYKMKDEKLVGDQIHEFQELLRGVEKKGTCKRSCFVCGRTNHVAKNCYYKKTNEHKSRYHNGQDRKGQRGDVNMVMEEKEIDESSFRYNPEINSTFEYQDWWLDSGANVHLGYKVVMESNKVVISKNDVFIGKGFVSDVLFKLNVSKEDDVSPNVLNVEICDLWHGQLGHVNLRKLRKMMDLDLVPKSAIDVKRKCEVCV
ncbi:hypothetical protein Vadar_005696 [Vaccinium darrowii]|uniref:Uncharacterized protein n=1 Tax=Vaccinium darrowii TaxID=229202 RepID=A0ACB7YTB1_9ERIC|nr:hypothetical protein Vadar_005696 [Vaccinium darrowii]